MSSNIVTYMLLYQVCSHVLVLVLYEYFEKKRQEISLSDVNATDLFQILLKIERTANLLSKLSRS